MNGLASLALGVSAVIHLVVAPEHFAHAPAHGIFFVLAGVSEIVWALAFLRWPSERMYYIGIVLAGALIIIWGLTRIIPAPFEHEIGEIDPPGILSKIGELVALAALVSLAAQGRIAGLARRTIAGFLAEAVVLAAFFGLGFYMVAHQVEPYMPFLGSEIHQEESEPEEQP